MENLGPTISTLFVIGISIIWRALNIYDKHGVPDLNYVQIWSSVNVD